MPDDLYIRLDYRLNMGKALHLRRPRTFQEKLQWLKLYDRRPAYTALADKYAAKQYVAEKLGAEYVIPTLGLWERPEDIPLELLPDQFVLKVTHDSGGVILCKDKSALDWEAVRKKLNDNLNKDYSAAHREWVYRDVPRRIIAEPYMEDGEGAALMDYKFYCFDGVPTFCQVISERETEECIDFFDMEWNHQNFTGLLSHKQACHAVERPKTFAKMIEAAAILSEGHPFLRVDLYEVRGRMYFGELTFYPASGFGSFQPAAWNEIMGDYIDLPTRKRGNRG
jgi:hypothetical protein